MPTADYDPKSRCIARSDTEELWLTESGSFQHFTRGVRMTTRWLQDNEARDWLITNAPDKAAEHFPRAVPMWKEPAAEMTPAEEEKLLARLAPFTPGGPVLLPDPADDDPF
jgi:hypothetical protein